MLGVEFSALLCGIAESNLVRYSKRSSRGASFQVVQADAAEYAIPDDVSVVFMFNPFDAVIMARVMQNIAASLSRQPRPLHVIYRHPLHARYWTDQGCSGKPYATASRSAISWSITPPSIPDAPPNRPEQGIPSTGAGQTCKISAFSRRHP